MPNGSYLVHVVTGDPDYTDSVYRVNVEGALAVSGTPSASAHWFEGSVQVTVTDGRLIVSQRDRIQQRQDRLHRRHRLLTARGRPPRY